MSIKVFVSYAAQNTPTLRNVLAAVKGEGIEALSAPQNVVAGQKFQQNIDDMINTADAVIALVTPQALMSAWVPYELSVAYDRNKPIIPLVQFGTPPNRIVFFVNQLHQIQYHAVNPSGGVGFAVGSSERDKLSTRLRDLKDECRWMPYVWHHFRERRITRVPFLVGLFIANLGFMMWWGIDRVWELWVQAGGPWVLRGRNNFEGIWPSIWAASSLLSIYVAVWLIIRMRRGTVSSANERRKRINGFFVFLASTAVSGYVFYNLSGVDAFLVRCGLAKRTVEFLSTTAWSITISGITILPFLVKPTYWHNVFSWKPLLGSIVITWITVMLTLAVYFAYMLLLKGGGADDVMRGQIVGAGLRSGMFAGIYFAAILSSVRP